MNAVEQLCPNCGLCCDGTLFADVELRKGDDAKRLEKLGLSLHKKGKTKIAFAQPCACFDGKLCKIYADRPKRCRLFECGLLKRVEAGKMTAGAALGKISGAKVLVQKVKRLLRTSGQGDEQLALNQRYTQTMNEPIDLADKVEAKRRGKLMLAVDDLMQRLQKDFLR
ncbi:MAG TPA: YkgJ family cysteine cluster protein [Verrucomicrobiae bacterium]